MNKSIVSSSSPGKAGTYREQFGAIYFPIHSLRSLLEVTDSTYISGTTLKVLGLLLSLLCFSCSPLEVKTPAPAVNTIKKGEKFRIILPENHAEFFLWKLDDKAKKKAVDYLNSVWHGNEKGVYYHFEAKTAGQDTLNFVLYKYDEVKKFASFIVKVE